MVLPTTKRGSTKLNLAPPQDAIVKAMEVATTPEAAEYLVEQFIKRMESLSPEMVEQSQTVLAILIEYRDNIMLLYSNSEQAWSGKEIPTDNFKRLQENLAAAAIDNILEQIQEMLTVNYAVDDNSQFIRGFVGKNGAVDDATAKQIDKLLNDFFAKHDMISRDGVVYEGSGKIQVDSQGQEQKASPEKLSEIMNEEFASYLKAKGITEPVVYQRDFPGQTLKDEPSASPGTAA